MFFIIFIINLFITLYSIYTFFELKVRHNLSEDEIDEVLRLARNKFENLGYRVYFTGAKYNYQGENRIVESNEYLVAIKGL